MPERTRLQKLLRALLLILLVMSLASLALGIRHALSFGSADLQWQGAWLVRHHVDPYAESLARHSRLYPHFSPPNYLYHLYVLLLPLSLLHFRSAEILWCTTSILLSAASVALLRRLYRLTYAQTIIAFSLLWIGAPARVTLEVGQVSFVILFFFCLAYLNLRTPVGGLAFGVTLAKYSFSPPAVLLALLRLRLRLLLFAAILPITGLIITALCVRTPIFSLALEPFRVSRQSVNPGLADVMTLAEAAAHRSLQPAVAQRVSYGLALGGSLLYALLLRRFRLSPQQELPLVTLAALFLFKHLVYDYVFLVIPLCFALSVPRRATRNLLIAGILPFWLLDHLLDRPGPLNASVNGAQLAFNVCLLAALLASFTFVALQAASQTTPRRSLSSSGLTALDGNAL